MRTMKKSLALTLALTMVLSLFAGITVFAASVDAITVATVSGTPEIGKVAPTSAVTVSTADVTGKATFSEGTDTGKKYKVGDTPKITLELTLKSTDTTGITSDPSGLASGITLPTALTDAYNVKSTVVGTADPVVITIALEAKVALAVAPGEWKVDASLFGDTDPAATKAYMKNTIKGGTITFAQGFVGLKGTTETKTAIPKGYVIAAFEINETDKKAPTDVAAAFKAKTNLLGSVKVSDTKAFVLKMAKEKITKGSDIVIYVKGNAATDNWGAGVEVAFPKIPTAEVGPVDWYRDAALLVVESVKPEDTVRIWPSTNTSIKLGDDMSETELATFSDAAKGLRYDSKTNKPVATIKVKKSLSYKVGGTGEKKSHMQETAAIISTKLLPYKDLKVSVQGKDQFESTAVLATGYELPSESTASPEPSTPPEDQDQLAVNTEAAKITTVTAPGKGDASLTLPTVPAAYTIAIKTSSDTNTIALDGTITPPTTGSDVSVNLVFTVTHTASGKKADTQSISVTVPDNSI